MRPIVSHLGLAVRDRSDDVVTFCQIRYGGGGEWDYHSDEWIDAPLSLLPPEIIDVRVFFFPDNVANFRHMPASSKCPKCVAVYKKVKELCDESPR